MANRFVNDLSRAEVLAELSSYTDDDGLDHTTQLDGRKVRDPSTLNDEDLRELLKLARMRKLLWNHLVE